MTTLCESTDSYVVGKNLLVEVAWTDEDGDEVAPTVTATWKTPGPTTPVDVTADLDTVGGLTSYTTPAFTQPGLHVLTFAATLGSYVDAQTVKFQVRWS